MGGGIHWLPRDFIKLGQVILDGGVWNGNRMLSKKWVARSTAALVNIDGRDYGYQWWLKEYSYRDKTIKAIIAGGNGGQVIIIVPELDLVVNFWGGNYNDKILYKAQDVLVPEYILKAVENASHYTDS